MFETTTADGVPMNIRLPFWQCVKAGIGFTLGAALVTVVGGFLMFPFSLALLGVFAKAMSLR